MMLLVGIFKKEKRKKEKENIVSLHTVFHSAEMQKKSAFINKIIASFKEEKKKAYKQHSLYDSSHKYLTPFDSLSILH